MSEITKEMKGEIAERCIAQWKSDPAIRHEFGTLPAYYAYCAADAQGLIRMITTPGNTIPKERS